MGSGRFDPVVYNKAATTYNKQDRTSLFTQKSIFSDFDPVEIKMRESCASKEHPDPTSIIIACDVTGSMGKIPEDLLKSGLGKIMESLLKVKSISNPQVMFAAIGDTECDKAPLQATQFESDNRIEAQLKNLFLEGRGGGNDTESYQTIWYFAAYKTRLDSLKKNKKGILFTMGDEMVPDVLKADHIRKFIDKDYKKGVDIPTSELIKEVTKKYEVFHLVVQDTDTYKKLAPKLNPLWEQYLGERAIPVAKYTEIPNKIISTIQSLCELSLQTDNMSAKFKAVTMEAKPNPSDVAPNPDKVIVFSNKKVPSDSSEGFNKDDEGVPYLFLCSLSHEVMEDPVTALDGNNYERKLITDWFKKSNMSPIKNIPMGGDLLIPNDGLKSAIKEWQEKQKASLNKEKIKKTS